MARATSSYAVEKSGNEVIFSVVAAEKRVPIIRRILISFGFFLIIWNVIGTKSDVGFVLAIVGAIAAYIIAGKMVLYLETGLLAWTTEKEFARQASQPLIGW